jgi:putative DNA primase/helicase
MSTERPKTPKQQKVADMVACMEANHADGKSYADNIAAVVASGYEIDAAEAWAEDKAEIEEEARKTDGAHALRKTNKTPIQAAREGEPFAMTDLGNAERLKANHGDKIRYDVSRKVWRVWDGRRWAIDRAMKLSAFAANTARNIRKEAGVMPPSDAGQTDRGAKLYAWGVRSESREKIASMVELLKSIPGVAIAADQFDTDNMAFNVENGTLDLRTGNLKPHNRADLITKLSPITYDPDATDDRWTQFLEDSTGGDASLIEYLKALVGYTLTGKTIEEIIIIVWGPAASGKSTFIEAVRYIMGDYGRVISPELLMRSKAAKNSSAASPEVAALAGARMAAGSELEQGREFDVGMTKQMTGGDAITARHLYGEPFDFVPQYTIWLGLNDCPKVSASDCGMWRRLVRVGFDRAVPKDKRDKTLKPHLRSPSGGAPAVLAWAVQGCVQWQRDGLVLPEAVRRSTDAYKEESDPLATFFDDCLDVTGNPNSFTLWTDIWSAYNEHAEEQGIAKEWRISPKRLQGKLKSMGGENGRRFVGRGWSQVVLKSHWQNATHDGHDTHDTNSKTFPHEAPLEKVYKKSVMTVMPDMDVTKSTAIKGFPELPTNGDECGMAGILSGFEPSTEDEFYDF